MVQHLFTLDSSHCYTYLQVPRAKHQRMVTDSTDTEDAPVACRVNHTRLHKDFKKCMIIILLTVKLEHLSHLQLSSFR